MTIPLSERRSDWVFILLYAVSLLIVLVSDIAQLTVESFADWEAIASNPPLWPPLFVLEALRDYGQAVDPLVFENPHFFRAIMFGDVFFLGPFYAIGIYAFAKGRNWIRPWSWVYAAHVLSYAPVLIAAQMWGDYASENPVAVLAGYSPFWVLPLATVWRLRRPQPFSRKSLE